MEDEELSILHIGCMVKHLKRQGPVSMNELAELLRAVASLLWPVFAFVAAVIYKSDLRSFLARILKLRFLGQEVELDRSLDKLHESASELREIPEDSSSPVDSGGADSVDVESQVLQEAARSPKVGLMLLSAEIEREARRTLAGLGVRLGRQTIRNAIHALIRYGISPSIVTTFDQFTEIRGMIMHGRAAVSDDEILRAIDSGLVLLRAIRGVPRETHKVVHVNVPLFSDERARERRNDVKGVILESMSPGGVVANRRIYPTTSTELRPGMIVSWSWESDRAWDETWYLDPESGDVVSAWQSAAEFTGQNIDDV